MTQQSTEIQPIPVFIANAGDILPAAREAERHHIRSTFRTFVLTAANPVIPVLAEDRSRVDVWMIAYGNSVVICESQSQAQDPDNQVAGAGNYANTPANPQGTLLYANPGATPAVMVSVRWTIETTEVVWATALAFPAYLAMTTHNKAKGY